MANSTVRQDSHEQVLRANIEALRAVDASLAERLEGTMIPDWVRPAVGRDGSKTWQLTKPGGSAEWFGRTSMPTISAEGLLSEFDVGAGNVALAGIGSGCAAKLLVERLDVLREELGPLLD